MRVGVSSASSPDPRRPAGPGPGAAGDARRPPGRRGHHLASRTSCDADGRAPVHRRRARPRHQVHDAAPHCAERGIETHVLPATATVRRRRWPRQPDGVFLSNGPGDPATADDVVALTVRCWTRDPVLRHLLRQPVPWASAGPRTYKLATATAGINQPVKDRATRRVEITAHNHGFAVDAPVAARPSRSARPSARRRVSQSASTTTWSRDWRCSTCRSYEVSKAGPPNYDDVGKLAKALAKAAPERMLWATNWPHPTPGVPVPDDAWMLDMLLDWIPDESSRNKALVTNPAKLYGF